MLRLLSATSHCFLPFLRSPAAKAWQVFTSATCSTKCIAQGNEAEEDITDQITNAAQVFRKWGCNDSDLAKIFNRSPGLCNADIVQLHSKLSLLSRIGFEAPDLVKIINCRPRFLNSRVNVCFVDRLAYLNSLFESKEKLKRAILSNPSLLTYDFDETIKPVLAQYEELGVNKEEFLSMVCLRPTIVSRSSFNEEKLEYIRRTGISKDSKLYKYVVTIIGISRVETICEKMTNFASCGLSDDEIFELIGRAPLVLTLSIEKVQRNMTFILGTMKFEAKTVLQWPHLLLFNLDTRLKPRALLMKKIQEMDGEMNFTEPLFTKVIRMKESTFVKSFIKRHPKEVADELMEFYMKAKEVKRLAGSSKKCINKGFPF